MNGLVVKAEAFATEKHKDQEYDGGPYTKHLRWVYDTALKFGCTDPELLAACWLHDTVEDTETTLDEIGTNFGPRVRDIVDRVTDKPGRNRRARHEATYPQIKTCPSATFVKLADRIANVEASRALSDNSSFMGMYRKEYADFRRLLYTEGVYEEMWAHLEDLLV